MDNKSMENFSMANFPMGMRCNICTGCGRCAGGVPWAYQGSGTMPEDRGIITVTMESGLSREVLPKGNFPKGNSSQGKFPLLSGDGRRLVAADIGTTTIAMQLYGRDGRVQDVFAAVNPQTKYGADVLSRIQAAQNPEAAKEMQGMAREVLAMGFSRFREHIAETESLFAVIAANTAMVYLLMGFDTEELGRAPFGASRLEGFCAPICGVPCAVFPGLSAFVGGDITAGIYALGMTAKKEITLLIDLGTNGEIVLGSRDGMIACATAAGPAFEGGANAGIWGADMVSLIARLRRDNIVDGTGLLADAYFEAGVRIGDVLVSQKNIRQIQLAKGAIAAGIRILAKECGIGSKEISRVVLAGGFGYYLNPRDAAEIGLLPRELEKKSIAGGNTALAGAFLLGWEMLMGQRKAEDFGTIRGEELLGCRAKIINLAAHPDFSESYLREMDL